MSGPTSAPAVSEAPSRTRTFAKSVGLLATLVAVTTGGYVVAGLAEERDEGPVEVAPGITLRPPPGWTVFDRREGDVTVVRLNRGNGNLDVFVVSFAGDARGALEAYRREALAPGAQRLQFSPETSPVSGPDGLAGARGSYVGVFEGRSQAVEGEVTAFTTGGRAIVFDAWADEGSLDAIREDVRGMIDSMELT